MSSKPKTQICRLWFCFQQGNMLSAQEPGKLQGLPWDLREAPCCDNNQAEQAGSFYGSKSSREKL